MMIRTDAILEVQELQSRIMSAKNIADAYGGVDGDHHKAWAIDQMVRALCGDDSRFYDHDEYAEFLRMHNQGTDGPDTYEWDEGIAP